MFEKIILKFDQTSEFSGKYVATDYNSGGYPYAVEDPTKARFWSSIDEALKYASNFNGSGSYEAYAIEQKIYKLTVEVVEIPFASKTKH